MVATKRGSELARAQQVVPQSVGEQLTLLPHANSESTDQRGGDLAQDRAAEGGGTALCTWTEGQTTERSTEKIDREIDVERP